MIALTLFLTLPTPILAQELQCFVPGACLNGSQVIGGGPTDSSLECLRLCTATTNCTWFTYYQSAGHCTTLANCHLDAGRDDAVSGQRGCPESFCSLPGQCLGGIVDFVPALDENDCLRQCQGHDRCLWYSFDLVDGACLLLESCDLNQDTDFVSGQKSCQLDSSILLLVGGLSETVEVIDLQDPDRVCAPLADLPAEYFRGQGAFYQSQPLVCGGDNDNCIGYDESSRNWSTIIDLSLGRKSAGGVLVDEDRFWITGGYDSVFNSLNASDLIVNGTATAGPDLQAALTSHCMLQISPTQTLIIGGVTESGPTRSARVYNWDSQLWTEYPDMNFYRYDASCGIITEGNEAFVVVVGSFNLEDGNLSAERYSLARGPVGSWEMMTPPPRRVTSSMAVTYNNALYIASGYDNVTPIVNSVLRFNFRDGWSELSYNLTSRYSHVAMIVPDEYCQ